MPQDGAARPVACADAMASVARHKGVRFLWDCPVSGIDVVGGRVRAVRAGDRRVVTETVVIATGIWAPLTGRLRGLRDWRGDRTAGRSGRREIELSPPPGLLAALRRNRVYRSA